MIVNVIEIFIEYMGIMLCLNKAAKKKLVIDQYVLIFFVISVLSVFLAHIYREEYWWLMLITYINLFVYTKIRLCKEWLQTIKVFGAMLITIPSLQLIIFFSIKIILDLIPNKNVMGIIVNCIVYLLIKFWKKEYIYQSAKKMVKSGGMLVTLVVIFLVAYVLTIYKKSDYIYTSVTLQSLVGIIGVGLVSVLLINAENERKSKAKELQLYEIYNKTFEEAIIAIRVRQHEFDNHINAIKCLQYTIDNPDDLVRAQNEYCDEILRENSINRILKLHTEPILTGFLYSKLMNATEQGIHVLHEIHAIEIKNRIDISEIIEILGILLDNAVEALLNNIIGDKTLIVKILREDEKSFSIEVSNRSKKYSNNEIEKFCVCGYSTKGENRGIGLTRVKEIAKKYKADFYIENINYNDNNFLCFKLVYYFKGTE